MKTYLITKLAALLIMQNEGSVDIQRFDSYQRAVGVINLPVGTQLGDTRYDAGVGCWAAPVRLPDGRELQLKKCESWPNMLVSVRGE